MLTRSTKFVIANSTCAGTFAITVEKLYVQVSNFVNSEQYQNTTAIKIRIQMNNLVK